MKGVLLLQIKAQSHSVQYKYAFSRLFESQKVGLWTETIPVPLFAALGVTWVETNLPGTMLVRW